MENSIINLESFNANEVLADVLSILNHDTVGEEKELVQQSINNLLTQ